MAITSAEQSSCLLRGQTQPGAEAAASPSSTVRCLIIDHYRLKVNLNTEVGERKINCHWSFGVGIGSEPGPHPLGDDRYVIENAMRESFGASQTFPSSSSSAVGASIRSSFGP